MGHFFPQRRRGWTEYILKELLKGMHIWQRKKFRDYSYNVTKNKIWPGSLWVVSLNALWSSHYHEAQMLLFMLQNFSFFSSSNGYSVFTLLFPSSGYTSILPLVPNIRLKKCKYPRGYSREVLSTVCLRKLCLTELSLWPCVKTQHQ